MFIVKNYMLIIIIEAERNLEELRKITLRIIRHICCGYEWKEAAV